MIFVVIRILYRRVNRVEYLARKQKAFYSNASKRVRMEEGKECPAIQKSSKGNGTVVAVERV